MPIPSEVKPRPPADFASALATAEPILLVGGQAVNLWALHYSDRSMGLAPRSAAKPLTFGHSTTAIDPWDLLPLFPGTRTFWVTAQRLRLSAKCLGRSRNFFRCDRLPTK